MKIIRKTAIGACLLYLLIALAHAGPMEQSDNPEGKSNQDQSIGRSGEVAPSIPAKSALSRRNKAKLEQAEQSRMRLLEIEKQREADRAQQ